jgi:uroporphyrinogen III methyltransferase / synthase
MTGEGSAPLRGVRVAITRPATDDESFARLLRERGAEPLLLPLLRIDAAPDTGPLLAAAAAVESFDWIVFTSANGVRFFRDALERARPVVGRAGPRARVAAVGPATAAAVAELLGWRVAAVPERFTGDAVAGAMQRVAPLAGGRVLWPRAVEARDALRGGLAALGALLEAPEAYVTLPLPENADALSRRLREGGVDVVTLTSPSAARCLAAAGPALGRAIVAVIGPSTGQATRAAGLPVHVEPEVHTLPALVDALSRHFSRT